jgi:hypothetical protein
MTAPRRFSLATVSVALAALALAGCGAQQGGVPAGGGPAGGTATTAPPTTVVTPTGGKVPGATAVRVDGVIERGVEPGCYVLTATNGGPKYLVVTKTPPPTDVPVHVEGTTMPGTMSYCQQGTPLHVTTVERR